ncbi:MAG: hypothetical protein A2X58_08610 [Nitrospirae bacterium GWC2_56_14]|nr:MAG: hypothetical protein A2X58_08610 [Nitrospirae bacterium GWC2_56_14]
MTIQTLQYGDLLGLPFRYHASGPDAYDCKGLVAELYRRLDVPFPCYDSSEDPALQHAGFMDGLARYTTPIALPEPYCLAMFSINQPYVHHCGLVLPGLYKFLHVRQHVRVCTERLDSPEWAHRLRGFYRLIPLDPGGSK